jgi:hypothetical protein
VTYGLTCHFQVHDHALSTVHDHEHHFPRPAAVSTNLRMITKCVYAGEVAYPRTCA